MDTASQNSNLLTEPKRRFNKAYSRAFICAVALTLVATVLGSGIFHVHRTLQDEASCTVCHIGHAPALAATVSNSLLPEPVSFGTIARPTLVSQASADASPRSSRAPPALV